MVKVLRAYTDGSCLNQKYINDKDHPRCAGIGVFFADNSELNVSEVFDLDNPTNIRAEFFAAFTAMQIMDDHRKLVPDVKYKIYIDCQLVISTFFGDGKCRPYIDSWKPRSWKRGDGISGWMKKDGEIPKNLDLIVPMYELFITFPPGTLQFCKVKAHRSIAPSDPIEYKHWYGNSKADEFATNASAKLKI